MIAEVLPVGVQMTDPDLILDVLQLGVSLFLLGFLWRDYQYIRGMDSLSRKVDKLIQERKDND